MIVEALLEIVGILLDFFLSPINIPDLPTQAVGFVEEAFTYFEMGAGLLANYTPLGYLLILFTLLVTVDAGILVYHFALWVLKKIPALGVS